MATPLLHLLSLRRDLWRSVREAMLRYLARMLGLNINDIIPNVPTSTIVVSVDVGSPLHCLLIALCKFKIQCYACDL